MAELKTKVTTASVSDFINSVSDESKKADSLRLLKIFEEITGEKPKMWGTSIIGFGQYHYKSERSSQEGDWPITGFSPRKTALTLYLMLGVAYTNENDKLFEKLGKHSTGKGCLYIKRLSDVDEGVLRKLIERNFSAMKKRYSK